MSTPNFGGQWTNQKLEILRAYLDAYTSALKNQRFTLTYVDAFAGAGSYAVAEDDYAEFHEFRRGSPIIALEVEDKPFDKLLFIEKDARSAGALLTRLNQYRGRQIQVVPGDANVEIPNFCNEMEPFDRAVVFLDPYATEVSWPTVEAIAKTKKIDCWILFPLMAVTRNMPVDREPDQKEAMTLDRVFGEGKYWQGGYRDSPQMSFLSTEPRRERAWSSEQIAARYKERLTTIFE